MYRLYIFAAQDEAFQTACNIQDGGLGENGTVLIILKIVKALVQK